MGSWSGKSRKTEIAAFVLAESEQKRLATTMQRPPPSPGDLSSVDPRPTNGLSQSEGNSRSASGREPIASSPSPKSTTGPDSSHNSDAPEKEFHLGKFA